MNTVRALHPYIIVPRISRDCSTDLVFRGVVQSVPNGVIGNVVAVHMEQSIYDYVRRATLPSNQR